MNDRLVSFVGGALAMGYLAAGLFFLRFWRQSHDRLFAVFAVSFFLLALHRVLLALIEEPANTTWLYLMRLAAFLLILGAIVDKNRRAP
jgi:hypothetical protein